MNSFNSSHGPRDERAGRPITTIDAFAFTWRRLAECAAAYQSRLGLDRYQVVLYESLVTDTTVMMG